MAPGAVRGQTSGAGRHAAAQRRLRGRPGHAEEPAAGGRLQTAYQREVCVVLRLPALHAAADRRHGWTRRLPGVPDRPGSRGGPGRRQGPDGALRGGGQRPPGLRAHPPRGGRRPQREPPSPQHAAVPRGAGGEGGNPAGAHKIQRRRGHGPPAGAQAPPQRSDPQHAGGLSPLHQRRLPPPRVLPPAAARWRAARLQLHGARLPGGPDPGPRLLPAGRRAATRLRGELRPPAAGTRGRPGLCALGAGGAGGAEPKEGGPGGPQGFPGSKKKPSQANKPVSNPHPQSDGQKSPEPHRFVTPPSTHQELPAAPSLMPLRRQQKKNRNKKLKSVLTSFKPGKSGQGEPQSGFFMFPGGNSSLNF